MVSLTKRFAHPQFCGLDCLQLNFLKLVFFVLLQCSTLANAQYSSEIEEMDDDPYLDPTAANEALNPKKRTASGEAFLLGISYGLNPIILLAPALNLSIYWDPVIIGLEFSDSELLGIWEKERQDNFGTSLFSGETQYIKWFFGENLYFIASREHRNIKLWSRTYNRLNGQAKFDMFIESTLASLGAGLLRFSELGFFSIDILRYHFANKHNVQVFEHWETWTQLSGNRDLLDQNIEGRSNKWIKTINAQTGFIVTLGFYY